MLGLWELEVGLVHVPGLLLAVPVHEGEELKLRVPLPDCEVDAASKAKEVRVKVEEELAEGEPEVEPDATGVELIDGDDDGVRPKVTTCDGVMEGDGVVDTVGSCVSVAVPLGVVFCEGVAVPLLV